MAFKLNEIEKAKMKEIMGDPVLWAKAFIRTNDPKTKKVVPWIARDYQAEMLRDTHTRLVFRCGRRCVAGRTMIFDSQQGRYRQAKDIFEKTPDDFSVVAYDTETYKQHKQKAKIWENGVKPLKYIKTHLGTQIIVTDNHPFLTATGWKNAEDLTYDDHIAIASHINFFGDNTMEENKIRLIANIYNSYIYKNKRHGFLLLKDSPAYKVVSKAVKNMGGRLLSTEDECFFEVKNEEILKLCHWYGWYGNFNDIASLRKEDLIIFFNELFKTHTTVKKKRIVEYNTRFLNFTFQNNRSYLIAGIRNILTQFGIFGDAHLENNFSDFTIDKNIFVIKTIETFGLQHIKDKFSEKDYAFYKNSVDYYDDNPFVPRNIIKLLDSLTKTKKKKILKELGLEVSYNKSLDSALTVLHHFGIHEYDEILTCDTIMWGRIVNMKDLPAEMTYDIEVDEYHNFVANQFITHNTGKTETMIVSALYKALTKPAFRVLFAAPYEHQINAFWMRLKEILANSPLLDNEVKRLINSPYMIEFKNGSAILGFTTGASSGSNAASMRGQKADWIFLDELDYMADGDYDTIAMIAAERDDIGITASSTPTGKRGTFYNMCTNRDMGYVEHYHPSHDNPGFTQEMDDSFKSTMTASAYEHEILAEFGTEDSGVFNKTMIDDARNKFNYCYLPPTDEILRRAEKEFGERPNFINYTKYNPAPPNPWRCMGVNIIGAQ